MVDNVLASPIVVLECTQVSGLYLICDGGYHLWRCLQFPLKDVPDIWARRWSKRLESVRKDVECAFGILKKRFRILKVPFLYKGYCTSALHAFGQ